jgi:hypothetical protein
LARILREIASEVEQGADDGEVQDINGKLVGKFMGRLKKGRTK